MKSLSDNSKEFMETIPDHVINIDISSQDWPRIYQQISNKLGISYIDENHQIEDYQKYSGLYKFIPPAPEQNNAENPSAEENTSEEPPKEVINKVHYSNDRLCLDAFWPNLKLLPLKKNLFSIESFHFLIRFNLDADKVVSFDFIENSPTPFLSQESNREEEFYRFYRL
jgi:hypothetical protein